MGDRRTNLLPRRRDRVGRIETDERALDPLPAKPAMGARRRLYTPLVDRHVEHVDAHVAPRNAGPLHNRTARRRSVYPYPSAGSVLLRARGRDRRNLIGYFS